MVVIHQADVLYMQNWDHVNFILSKCNKLPLTDHNSEFFRIRPYFLNEKGAEHRQLIITSHFSEPKIQGFFREFGKSCSGTVWVKKNWGDGDIGSVYSKVHQVFQSFPCNSFETEHDDRFNFFSKRMLTQLVKINHCHTMIIAPSYFSYVRIRNELLRLEANASFICEYSRESEISRSRSNFFHGKTSILLYSGRFHFFRRFKIRGALHVIFYALPEYPHFFSEIVNNLGNGLNDSIKSAGASCSVLISKFDKLSLERVVGVDRCEGILSSKKSVFMLD